MKKKKMKIYVIYKKSATRSAVLNGIIMLSIGNMNIDLFSSHESIMIHTLIKELTDQMSI